MTQTALTVSSHVKHGWSYEIRARFDSEPSIDDIYAASKSIGFGINPAMLTANDNIPEEYYGGYILSDFKVEKINSDKGNSNHLDNGLWLAIWQAILD